MEDNDPHKRMRRFGELCGCFYGRRFFGLETIMSDRDSDHMLLELQEARAEIDRLRNQLVKAKKMIEGLNEENKELFKNLEKITDNYLKISAENKSLLQLWRPPIGPLPGGE